jgi:ABC-type spermidine/putrescine transport system permease subunit II
METLNDFGTVDFFAVSTFTLGIYDVWLNMNNIAGAAQLSAVLLVFVMVLVVAERFARQKKRFHQMTTKYDVRAEYLLEGRVKIIAIVTCLMPVSLGFLVPGIILIRFSFIYYETSLNADFLSLALNSLTLSSLAAILAIFMGVFMAYGVRLRKERLLKIMTGLACMGYAVPGSVLAVGVMFTLGTIDNGIDGFLLAPVITLEPRWYYNLNKRESKSKRIDGNSGNFLSIKTSYHPDWFIISNEVNINLIRDISIVPTWGIRRNIGKYFNYETVIGFGYVKYLEDENTIFETSDVAVNLHLRIGYRF